METVIHVDTDTDSESDFGVERVPGTSRNGDAHGQVSLRSQENSEDKAADYSEVEPESVTNERNSTGYENSNNTVNNTNDSFTSLQDEHTETNAKEDEDMKIFHKWNQTTTLQIGLKRTEYRNLHIESNTSSSTQKVNKTEKGSGQIWRLDF